MLSLAMGATSMPRMNVITSLICRKTLAERTPNSTPRLFHDMMHSPIMNTKSSIRYSSPPVIVIGEYNPQCASKEVESATAMFNLWGNLIAGIIAAAATPFWGKLSDRVGRLKPLAAATCVLNASEILMVLVAKYPDSLSLSWVYLTYVLEGLR
jgi:MFS family permease